VNTDLIIPGRYLDKYDEASLAEHAMEGLSPYFAKEVAPGAVIVAGKNFGCGSSREQAVLSLKAAGVSAVVARSFARIFYRNAINLGLTALVSSDACEIFQDGDRAVVDSDDPSMTSQDGSKTAHLEELPPHVANILRSGGLVAYLKERVKKG
jgi:3-isopropylmalate/(R)-2-methylmalate dehydratase small subunit